MTGYRLTPAARADLAEIWDYTARTWGRLQAERYLLAIRDACESASQGPHQGQAIDTVRPGYRKRAAGSHVVFYRIGEDGHVEIIRVLHQRMDVTTRLAES
jgi:toxin ParE1/3/4